MGYPRNEQDQQVRPPFLENYVDAEDNAESIEYHIHHFGDLDSEIYLTEEEHNMFAQVDDNALAEELEQYHKGYMHAIDDVRKIKLGSRDVAINKGGLNPNQPSSSHTSAEKEMKNKKSLLYIKKLEMKLRK